ncbi:MAG: hypothetical protein AB1422_07345 [bacterium]
MRKGNKKTLVSLLVIPLLFLYGCATVPVIPPMALDQSYFQKTQILLINCQASEYGGFHTDAQGGIVGMVADATRAQKLKEAIKPINATYIRHKVVSDVKTTLEPVFDNIKLAEGTTNLTLQPGELLLIVNVSEWKINLSTGAFGLKFGNYTTMMKGKAQITNEKGEVVFRTTFEVNTVLGDTLEGLIKDDGKVIKEAINENINKIISAVTGALKSTAPTEL